MPPPAEGFASRLILGPALRTQPDRRLVTLVREGYEIAFEEIVRRYGKLLTRYAATIVGSRSEDVAQDAFSKALLALRRDHAEIELRPWLFRIVRNTALNDLRDSPPSPEILAEAIAVGGNPAEELERREELSDLIKRLQALPESQRAAIVMRELEGLSHEEIAAALGLSGGGARQAIYRARQALRNGVGMLLPLPLLKAMLAGAGPSATEAVVGAAAGAAFKATAATVLIAGAVGAGVAFDHGAGPGNAEATALPTHSESRSAATAATPTAKASSDQSRLIDRSESHAGRNGREGGGNRGGRFGGPGENRGGSSGSGSRGKIRNGAGEGENSGPSRSDSPSHGSGSGKGSDDGNTPGSDGGDSGSGSDSGPGGGSGSGDDGLQSDGSMPGNDSGTDSGAGSGGGDVEESLSVGGSSDGSGGGDGGESSSAGSNPDDPVS